MVKGVQFGFLRRYGTAKLRGELVGVFELSEYREQMSNEMVELVPNGQSVFDRRFVKKNVSTVCILPCDKIRAYVHAPLGISDHFVKIFHLVRAFPADGRKTVVPVMTAVIREKTEVFEHPLPFEKRRYGPAFDWRSFIKMECVVKGIRHAFGEHGPKDSGRLSELLGKNGS